MDDVVLAFEPLQWEETDALAIQYNGRVVKEDMCHFGGLQLKLWIFLLLAVWGKANGVMKGVIAVCQRTSHLILTCSHSVYSLLSTRAKPVVMIAIFKELLI